MAQVLLARHQTTRVAGALKLVSADTGEDAELTARFRREVEILASLRHPAVVRLLDAGEVDDAPWLVMEYVAGSNLERRILDGTAPDRARALVEFAALADGLAYAHDQGVQHRDIKAENVVVDGKGRAVLVDFGVALHLSASRLTKAGNVMGTMVYLPPEVLEGAPADGATHDQYALAQLLSEVLSKKVLFRDGTGGPTRFAQLLEGKQQAVDPGPDVPEKVRAVIRRATDPEPEKRFPTMRAFAEALAGLLTRAQRAELDRRLGRSDGSGRWKWAVAALVVLVFLGAFALGGAAAVLIMLYVVLA